MVVPTSHGGMADRVMAYLFDQFTGGLLARRDGTGPDAGAVLRRLAQGRQAGLAARAGLMALACAAMLWAGLEGASTILAARASVDGGASAAAAPQAWVDVNRPIPIYDLGGTDFAKLPRSYRARRHLPDGTREDVLTFGKLGDDKPFLRIDLRRQGDVGLEDGAASPLDEALALAAGASGDTVTRMRPLSPIVTRFGAVERADLMLWDDGTATACLGFRGSPDGGRVLDFAGFACGAGGPPLAEAALACAMDRLDLLSAGDDHALRELFVAAARRPGAAACREGVLAAGAVQAPDTGPFAALRRRAAWLESGSGGPPLRGALDATSGER